MGLMADPKEQPTDPSELSTEPEAQELTALWLSMTPKQKAYCEARLAGSDSRKAIAIAGGDHRVNFEHHPKVGRYLALSTRCAVRRTLVSRNDVINGFLDAVDAAATSQELTQAWCEIGRVIGAYEPEKVQITVRVQDMTVARLASMSTDDPITMTRRNGRFEVDVADDPSSDEYQAFRAALEEPVPIGQGEEATDER